jgi:hypothetical protein
MHRKASPPAIETAAVWVAALSLGGAVAFAMAQVAPLGAGLVGASGAGAIAALAAWMLVGRVDRRSALPAFEMVPVTARDMAEEDVLLLKEIVEEEPLLLDDPLPRLRDDSRVVRLFATLPDAQPAAPLVGPGEMIARIEDFLGHSRMAFSGEQARGASKAASEDASAALHSALADIRRSLRQA